MKKETFTRNRSSGWLPNLGRATLLLLFTFCVVVGLNAQSIQMDLSNDAGAINTAGDTYLLCDHLGTVFTGCGDTYTDDNAGGAEELYNDDLKVAIPGPDYEGEIFWTFCPDSPMDEKIRLTFSKFDVRDDFGDIFRIYNGDCGVAQLGADFIEIAGISPSDQHAHFLSGNAPDFGSGWVDATCDNISGCLTIGWNPNDDDNKGAGWEFTTSCEDRGESLRCPDATGGSGPNTIFGGTILGSCQGDLCLTIPSPQLRNCASAGQYYVEVLVNGSSQGYSGGALEGGVPRFNFANDLIAQGAACASSNTTGTIVNLPVGAHNVTYVLHYDMDEDGDGAFRPTDAGVFEKDRIDCGFTIVDDQDLVCNDNVNVSLGQDCETVIQVDHLVEGLEATFFPPGFFSITVSDPKNVISGTFLAINPNPAMFANGEGVFFKDENGNGVIDGTEIRIGNELSLSAGEYTYTLTDGCGNACTGEISLTDLQGPQCNGGDVEFNLCGSADEAVAPNFIDCSGIDSTSLSFDELVFGNCGQFTAAERDQAVNFFYIDADWFTETAPGSGIFTTTTQVLEPTVDINLDGVIDALDNILTVGIPGPAPPIGGYIDINGNLADVDGDGIVSVLLGFNPVTGDPIFGSLNITTRAVTQAIEQISDHLISDITIRQWKVRDTRGNLTENCPQIIVNVRPAVVNAPTASSIVVSCGEGTSPTELLALTSTRILANGVCDTFNRFSGTQILPNFTVSVPSSFSPLTGSGASAVSRGVIRPDEHAACGWIAQFTDREIEACGNSKKIVRSWSWVDWCNPNPPTAGTNSSTQIIEVVDNTEPGFASTVPDTISITAGHFDCSPDIRLDPTEWADGCGDVVSFRTEIVAYRDVNGNGSINEDDARAAKANGEVLWRNNSNGGNFASIDIGEYWVFRYATDECGNETSRNDIIVTPKWDTIPINVPIQTLRIVDEVQPQAQCDDQINLSLGTDWGRVRAIDVDEGSFDNCWIGSMEVALEDVDSLYAEHVDISCDDVHEDLKVYLKVTDESGNSNVCWGLITVEDKLRPACTAPDDVTLGCDDLHFADLLSQQGDITGTPLMIALNELAGSPECVDNLTCVELGMEQSITIDASDCGEYTIVRSFVASDWNQSSDTVTQTITVEYRPDWKLTFPADATISCGEEAPAALGATDIIVSEGPCDQLTLNVEEKIFTGGSDACVKIIRTYTVWNNCGAGDSYNVNADAGESLMVTNDSTDAQSVQYVQTIRAEITEGPTVDVTLVEEDNNDIIGSADKESGTCTSTKTFEAWAHDCLDNLVPSGNVTLVITDEDGNEVTPVSTEDLEGGILVTVEVGEGTYTAEAWATDGCGNSAGATTSETFTDVKAPALWLLNGLATEIMPIGQSIDIWASDFLNGVGDNCTASDDVTLGIWHSTLGDAPTTDEDVAALGQSLLFGCDQVGNNLVRVYATDDAGNWDYVETYIIIQDNNGVCPQDPVTPTDPSEVQVAGKVVNATGEYIEAVNVEVNGGMSSDMTTGTAGLYAFSVPVDGDYTITPEKDINPLNGVSTFDLVLISKHILGIQSFDSPFQYIAADINNSGSITAFDMVQLRQLILNITTEFQNNTSWRFVDASYDFGTDATTTLSQTFPEAMNINNIAADMLTVDFVGVKVGDVNGSARPNNLVGAETRSTAGSLVLTTADQFVTAGETVSVAFTAAELAAVQGYQFTMNFAGLDLVDVVEGIAKAENFNTNMRGALATSWNGTATANDVLFTANFTANTSGLLSNLINVSSEVATAEAYSVAGEVLDIAIEFTGDVAQSDFTLMQNTPNPFNGETVIGFTLPQAGAATLKVMDVQGKVLSVVTKDFVKGYNQISLNANELGATGVLHYQLESANNVATMKMIILE